MMKPLRFAPRLSQAVGWRLITATGLAAVVCWLVVLGMLRTVVAQTSGTAPEQVEVETNEEEVVSRRVLPQTSRDEELPEFRDSADNNVSFPVDI